MDKQEKTPTQHFGETLIHFSKAFFALAFLLLLIWYFLPASDDTIRINKKMLESKPTTSVVRSGCEEIKITDDYTYDARRRCEIDFAVERGIDYCKSLPNASYIYFGCILKFATEINNDSSLCDELKDPIYPRLTISEAEECYKYFSIVNMEAELCGRMDSYNARDCYVEYSKHFNISEQCNAEFKSEHDTFNTNIAAEACVIRKLKGRFGGISIFGIGSLERAGNILKMDCSALTGVEKNDCYTNKAIINSSVTYSFCDKAGVEYTGCATVVSIRNKDLTACIKNSDVSSPEPYCISQIATFHQDWDFCLEQADCLRKLYRNIGEHESKTVTFQQCLMLKNAASQASSYVDKCFWNVAKRDLNINACNEINGIIGDKEKCMEVVQHALEN